MKPILPPPWQPPAYLSWLVSAALASGLLLAVLLLPIAPVVALLVAGVAVGVGLIARALGLDLWGLPRALRGLLAWDRVELPSVTRRMIAVEGGVLLIFTLLATHSFWLALADPNLQYSTGESEWITNALYLAARGLREYGRIPLWQPWLEFGEPLVNNPVGFLLNPFASLPGLLFGAIPGIKISVPLLTLLAGLGGWFLGWVMGFGPLARLLLGLLLVGKGNMSAMFNTGYLQLAASQVFFPWITAGTLAIFRLPERRWPVVMTALAFTLLWYSGNVWYTLPMLMLIAGLALLYTVGKGGRLDWHGLRRLALAGILTVALSAATLLPLAAHWERLGKHPPQKQAGWQINLLWYVAPFYVNPDPRQPFEMYDPQFDEKGYQIYLMDRYEEIYYSFVTPIWLPILLFAIPLYRPGQTQTRRFWPLAWALLFIFTQWGAGGQPLWLWLYEAFPPLREWRFVGRALAVGSFLIAILLATRLDSLWLSAVHLAERRRWGRRSAYALVTVITLGSLIAAWQVNAMWYTGVQVNMNKPHPDARCIAWLRQLEPRKDIAVWRGIYNAINTYVDHRVRVSEIYADFEMTPLPATLGKVDLTLSMPEYAIAQNLGERSFLGYQGYKEIANSPRQENRLPCLYRKANALSYAYTVPVNTVQTLQPMPPLDYGKPQPELITIPVQATTPVTDYIRGLDFIALAVPGSGGEEWVLTLQERAYPGWQVEVDGQPARLESVGGQIGVILPLGTEPHTVYFVYRPPLLMIGGLITILAAVVSAGYLLRVDVHLSGGRRRIMRSIS